MTNLHNLPDALAEALSRDDYQYDDAPHGISVTGLISPPKIRELRRRHRGEIAVDVSERIWVVMGHAAHHLMSSISQQNRLIEERMMRESGQWIISGQPDYYDGFGVLQDYKVTSAWSLVYADGGFKPEWEAQLNLYRWIIEGHGLPVVSMQIVAILRDWSKTNAMRDPHYPQAAVKVIGIPKWDTKTLEDYISARLVLQAAAVELPDDDIPPCTAVERWAKPTTWAVMKDGRKSAVRVLSNEAEALAMADELGKNHHVEMRVGEDTRCMHYCECRPICSYGRELTDTKEVKDNE